MSTRILILKDGVITPSRSSNDITSINTSLGITAALALKANLVSPALTGTPTTPTATAGTNTTQIANTAFVSTAISNLVASSPAALDTLNELATALGNDANFSTTITNALSLKAPLISPSFTTPNLGTPSAGILTNATGLPLATGVVGSLPAVNGGITTIAQTFTGAKTFSEVVRVGGAGIGNIRLTPGSAVNAGYLELFRADGTTRVGYIGYDNTNITYVSEVGLHLFNGGTVSITSPVQSTSTTTGALVVSGGQAVGGNLNVEGTIKQTINYTFKAGASTTQSIPNAAWTKVILNSEVIDSGNQYDPTTSRLTAITTEIWRINIFITVTVASANTRILLSVWKNGAEVAGTSRLQDIVRGIGGEVTSLTINEFPLVASDYLEVYCYTTPASSLAGEPQLIAVSWNGKRVN